MENGKKYPKKFLALGVALLIAAVITIGYLGSMVDQATISQDFAQEQVSQRLPITKNLKVLPLVSADFTVRDMTVIFRDDAQLEITAKCDLTSEVGDAEIEVNAIGIPEFHNKDAAFYFKPTQIKFTRFDFSQKAEQNAQAAGEVGKGIIETQLNGKSAAKLKSIASALGGVQAEKVVDKKLNEARAKAAEISPQDIAEKLKAGSLSLISESLTAYLNKCPIKKLDGAKGAVISLAVEEIRVENKEMIIEFSLLKLTGTLILYALVFIALIAAAVTAPFWMSVAAVFP
ncbi:MAG: DUF1439 domain-containing protein [Candidatus Buchananbacteria bacterium]|jgi:hypothetical protein